ncbi:hypothetical protein V6N12_019777 [Hibiscus sabdariffa]|uniref:Uncharacterized protein n=1 Tax=Hibiscus sabdariffa TaxID=183260 RepID=A0ABR2AZI5_9ROSI
MSLRVGNCSRLWRGFSLIWDDVRGSIKGNVRNDMHTRFWFDVWLDKDYPLRHYYIGQGEPVDTCVADWVTRSGEWNWPQLQMVLPTNVLLRLAAIPTPNASLVVDVPCWR